MKRIFVLAAILMWLALMGLFFITRALTRTEKPIEYYATYGDLQKSLEIRKGWLPPIVPSVATEIYERHNSDTLQLWMKFTLPANEISYWLQRFDPVTLDQLRAKNFSLPTGTWWPTKLMNPTSSDTIRYFSYTRPPGGMIPNGQATILIDATDLIVYYVEQPPTPTRRERLGLPSCVLCTLFPEGAGQNAAQLIEEFLKEFQRQIIGFVRTPFMDTVRSLLPAIGK